MSPNIPEDGIVVKNAKLAVERELDKKRALKQPIANFDVKTKQIYMQNGDGSITVLGEAMRQGRYSERRRQKT